MKSNWKKILQNIQDAYAVVVDMTIFITDKEGNMLTSMSGITPFIESLVFYKKIQFFNQLKKIIDQFTPFSNCITIDPVDVSSRSGIKCLLMPITIKGKTQGYIWCGAFIEEGYTEFVKAHLVSQDESNKWQEAINFIPVVTNVQLQEKKMHLEKMADVCGEILKTNVINEGLNTLEQLVDALNSNAPYNQLLEILMENKNIEYIGIATVGMDTIKIKSYLGLQENNLLGFSFDMEQTFFEQALLHRNLVYWENLGFDPRLSFLMQNGIKSSAFFCYPVHINNKVSAFVFGGKTQISTISGDTLQSIRVVGKLIEIGMNNEWNKSSLDLHLMKLSMLMEISKVMSTIKNRKDRLLMTADIAHSLVPSHFTSVTTDTGDYEYLNITNKVNDTIIDEYCRNLREFYFDNEENRAFQSSRIVEKYELVILEYPVRINGTLQGIISVSLQRPSEIKEAEAYLSSLSVIKGMVLKTLSTKSLLQNEVKTTLTSPEPIEATSIIEQLTARELEVLKLVVKGMSNKEIADELYISTHTVKNHITNILNKLGVTDRTQIIAMIYQLNYGNYIAK